MIAHLSMCTLATIMQYPLHTFIETAVNMFNSCAPRHCLIPCTSGLKAYMVFLLTDWVFSKMNTEMVFMVVMTIQNGQADFVTKSRAKSPLHRAMVSWNSSDRHRSKFQCEQENNAASWHKMCKHW